MPQGNRHYLAYTRRTTASANASDQIEAAKVAFPPPCRHLIPDQTKVRCGATSAILVSRTNVAFAPKPDPGRAGVEHGSLHYWSVICFNPTPLRGRNGEALMTRREFIATVPATASWPIVARAQKRCR